jgi:hypothetical protein
MTVRMRRRSARRGGLGNELLRVDCIQTMEGGTAGLAGAPGVRRPRGVAAEQSKKKGLRRCAWTTGGGHERDGKAGLTGGGEFRW